MTKQLLWTKWT